MQSDSDNLINTAIIFEGALVPVALLLGLATELNPLSSVSTSLQETIRAVGYGFAGAIGLLVWIPIIERVPLRPLSELRKLVSELVEKIIDKIRSQDRTLKRQITQMSVLSQWTSSGSLFPSSASLHSQSLAISSARSASQTQLLLNHQQVRRKMLLYERSEDLSRS